MSEPTIATISETTAALQDVLLRLREVLAGRQTFSLEDLRSADELLRKMAPTVSAGDHRIENMGSDLKLYVLLLRELDATLEKIRFMLVARKSDLETARSHVQRTRLWAETFQQTQ